MSIDCEKINFFSKNVVAATVQAFGKRHYRALLEEVSVWLHQLAQEE